MIVDSSFRNPYSIGSLNDLRKNVHDWINGNANWAMNYIFGHINNIKTRSMTLDVCEKFKEYTLMTRRNHHMVSKNLGYMYDKFRHDNNISGLLFDCEQNIIESFMNHANEWVATTMEEWKDDGNEHEINFRNLSSKFVANRGCHLGRGTSQPSGPSPVYSSTVEESNGDNTSVMDTIKDVKNTTTESSVLIKDVSVDTSFHASNNEDRNSEKQRAICAALVSAIASSAIASACINLVHNRDLAVSNVDKTFMKDVMGDNCGVKTEFNVGIVRSDSHHSAERTIKMDKHGITMSYIDVLTKNMSITSQRVVSPKTVPLKKVPFTQ